MLKPEILYEETLKALEYQTWFDDKFKWYHSDYHEDNRTRRITNGN